MRVSINKFGYNYTTGLYFSSEYKPKKEGVYKEELYADVKTVKIEPYVPQDFPEVNIPIGNSRRTKNVRHIKIEYDQEALATLPKVSM